MGASMPDASVKHRSSVLTGWKEIAIYLNMGLRTVQRYEQEHQLPVLRLSGKLKGPVLTTKSELDRWVGSFSRDLVPPNTLPGSRPEEASLRSNISRAKSLRLQTVELGSKLVGSIAALQRTVALQAKALNGSGKSPIPSNQRLR